MQVLITYKLIRYLEGGSRKPRYLWNHQQII